jgi:S1-C subfamily serine protease
MSNLSLATLSDAFADLAAAGAASVVQVLGARRSASGVVHGEDTIVTTARAIGREDGLRVRVGTGEPAEADLAGWDPATGIAVLRLHSPAGVPVPQLAAAEPRPGEIVLAVARSWSNALTVSPGVVAVVGGPLRTGRGREIPRVIRVTASMHDGFAGGALFDATGRLSGIATASAIRGFGVGIPASIAWASAARVLSGGASRRGFIGVAVQRVSLPTAQRTNDREHALLVVGITPGSPAETAGLIVGDVLVDVDGRSTESPEHLLEVLTGHRVGETIAARILRGGAARDVQLTVADRTR